MPVSKQFKRRRYQDLNVLERDNVAKNKAMELGAFNFLRDTPIVESQIEKADLSEIKNLMRSNITLINTIKSYIDEPKEDEDPGKYVSNRNLTSFIKDSNKVEFQLRKMIDILEEYDNPEDIKKINPKDWNKAMKDYNEFTQSIESLFELWDEEMDEDEDNYIKIDPLLMAMFSFGGRVTDLIDNIEGNLRTFGGSRQERKFL